jgi:hypothetical protein
LVKQIDRKINKNDRLRSFVVVLTDQGDRIAEELRKLAKDGGLKHVPLTMHQESAGPPNYELAPEADVTILMWRDGKVKVNHASKGELTDTDIRAILADIPKVLRE